MGLHSCSNRRRRVSVTLDAGYVVYRPAITGGLHGRKLISVIVIICCLFIISLINLICLLCFMYQLDWSFVDPSGSRIFQIDEINQQVRFSKQVRSINPVYTKEIIDHDRMQLSANKQIDVYGHRNSILFDENRIFLQADRFHWTNQTLINFNHIHAYQFDSQLKTRIHLDQLQSEHIHNKRLNVSARKHLTVSEVNQAFFYSHNILFEADRYNRRSILRFDTHSKRKKMSSNGFHMKGDSVYFDLPQFPLLGQNYRSESNTGRICICEKTSRFYRVFAHESCPFC